MTLGIGKSIVANSQPQHVIFLFTEKHKAKINCWSDDQQQHQNLLSHKFLMPDTSVRRFVLLTLVA
jgi:hypothetical protein